MSIRTILKVSCMQPAGEGRPAHMVSIVGEGRIGKQDSARTPAIHRRPGEDIYYHSGRLALLRRWGHVSSARWIGSATGPACVRRSRSPPEPDEAPHDGCRLYAPDEDRPALDEPRYGFADRLASMPRGNVRTVAALRAFFQGGVSAWHGVDGLRGDTHWADEGLLGLVRGARWRTDNGTSDHGALPDPPRTPRTKAGLDSSQKRPCPCTWVVLTRTRCGAGRRFAPGWPARCSVIGSLTDRTAFRSQLPLTSSYVCFSMPVSFVHDGTGVPLVGEDQHLAIRGRHRVAAILGARLVPTASPTRLPVIQPAAVPATLVRPWRCRRSTRQRIPVNLESTLRDSSDAKSSSSIESIHRSPELPATDFVQSLFRSGGRLQQAVTIPAASADTSRSPHASPPSMIRKLRSCRTDSADTRPRTRRMLSSPTGARMPASLPAARAAALRSDRQAAGVLPRRLTWRPTREKAMSLRLALADALEGADRPASQIAISPGGTPVGGKPERPTSRDPRRNCSRVRTQQQLRSRQGRRGSAARI